MIQRISDTVSMVFTENGFAFSNGVLVEDDIRLMIDSGVGPVMSPSVKPETVDLLLCSHSHIDHIHGNDAFSNAVIRAHPLEQDSMRDPEMIMTIKGWDELMHGVEPGLIGRLLQINPRLGQPWRVDAPLADGDIIDCGKTKIRVVHTPGHSRGHCCFHFLEEDFIFTADICLSKVGPWYGDPWIGIDEFLDSIERIVNIKPGRLATGHAPGVFETDIPGILGEYADRIHRREKRILELVGEAPATIDELAEKKPVYGKHASTFVLFWEKCMIRKHLCRLIEQECVEECDGGRYAAR